LPGWAGGLSLPSGIPLLLESLRADDPVGVFGAARGDEDCLGVVFYLSKNILSTNSVCEEIEITRRHKRPHFCVNLEGSMYPSRMLIEILVEGYQKDPQNFTMDGKNMMLFLDFFTDDAVFAHKFRDNKDVGTAHFESLVDAITTKFPELIFGE